MMPGDTAAKVSNLSETQHLTRETGLLLSRKIWLPRALYNALPTFYFIAGVAALLATLYVSAWFWVLPHYLLFSAACIHMAILVHRRRHRDKS